jgi:hypothetical protein
VRLWIAVPVVIAATLVVGAATGAAIVARSASDARGVRADPLPRSLDGRRVDNVRYGNETLYDLAFETCESYEIRQLARRYGVSAEPVAVATAFAAGYERSFRKGSYNGCLAGLIKHE